MSWMVQSTVTVSPTRRSTPVRRPACLRAYGCPMIPAPLETVRSAIIDSVVPNCLHYTVCHVHKGASHIAPRPCIFEMVLRVKVHSGCECDGWSLNVREQRHPLPCLGSSCPSPIAIPNVIFFIHPGRMGLAVGRSRYDLHVSHFKSNPIRSPRRSVRPLLRKGRLPARRTRFRGPRRG